MRREDRARIGQAGSQRGEFMTPVADTLRLHERPNGAGRGVRPKGARLRALVSQEEVQGGAGARRGRRSGSAPGGEAGSSTEGLRGDLEGACAASSWDTRR